MSSSTRRSDRSSQVVMLLVLFGFLLVFFSFGKGLIDLATAPPTINLEADDQIAEGFLPIYAEEDDVADAQVMDLVEQAEQSQEPGAPQAQPFPTEQAPAGGVVPTPDPGLVPDRLAIPTISLDAVVIPIGFEEYSYEGKKYQQWLAPSYRAVGWHETSVGLGASGNTVFNGHHNIHGEVFRDLYQVQSGDVIEVSSGAELFRYVVVYTDILLERNQPLEVRLSNSEWIQTTEDERITLITCWPYESNTHRVVVVAVPIRADSDG